MPKFIIKEIKNKKTGEISSGRFGVCKEAKRILSERYPETGYEPLHSKKIYTKIDSSTLQNMAVRLTKGK